MAQIDEPQACCAATASTWMTRRRVPGMPGTGQALRLVAMTSIVDSDRFNYQTVEWDALVQIWMQLMTDLNDIALFAYVVDA